MLFGFIMGGSLYAENSQGVYVKENVGIGLSPTQALSSTMVYYNIPLNNSTNNMFKTAHLELGVCNDFSLAYNIISGYVNYEPFAIFDVTFKAGFVDYYKTFNNGLIEYPDYSTNHSPEALANMTQTNGSGLVITLKPCLKVPVGPVLFLDTLTVNYFNVPVLTGYFYDRSSDQVIAQSDWTILNDTYIYYKLTGNFMAGLNNWIINAPFSTANEFTDRVGLAGYFQTSFADNFDFFAQLVIGTCLNSPIWDNMVYARAQAGITLKVF